MLILKRPAAVITPPVITKPDMPRQQQLLATQTARNKAAQVKTLYKLKHWRTWAELTRDTGMRVTSQHSGGSFSEQSLDQFLSDYVALAALSMAVVQKSEASIISTAALAVSASHHEVKIEQFTLRPQQRKSVDRIIEVFWEQKLGNAVLNPLRTGAGKSIIAGTIFKHIQDQKWFGRQFILPDQAKCVFITKKAVVEKIIRTFKRMGLKNVGRNLFGNDICVLHYGSLRAKANNRLFVDWETQVCGSTATLKRYNGEAPICVVLDECQEIKKWDSSRTQYVWGFFHNRRGKDIKWLFTSATPGITLNDMMAFAVFSGTRYDQNDLVTRDNFPAWIRQFGGDPRKPNAAAMERFRDHMGALVVSPPNDPSRVKATNKVTLLEFRTDAERTKYADLEREWVEALERVGRGISDRGLAMAQFQIYRAGSELLSAPYVVEKCIAAINEGHAAVAAFCFQESVRDWTLGMIERAEEWVPAAAKRGHIPAQRILPALSQPQAVWAPMVRKLITLIWGGDKAITEEEIFRADEANKVVNLKVYLDDVVELINAGTIDNIADLMTNDIVVERCGRNVSAPIMEEGWDKKEAIEWVYSALTRIPLIAERYPNITTKKLITRYRKWAKYTYERVKRDESEEDAKNRRAKLLGIRLVAMSDDERQLEVDKFQEGTTLACCYTLAAGGTGIDLDQQIEGVWPRHVFSTICYYAEEFMQALGRCMRVATLSDVTQEILFFANTIAADHVAPRLMKKVASIAKIASSTDDLVSVLESCVIKKLEKQTLTATEVVDETASEVDDSEGEDDDE